jgi:hypothetical protein
MMRIPLDARYTIPASHWGHEITASLQVALGEAETLLLAAELDLLRYRDDSFIEAPATFPTEVLGRKRRRDDWLSGGAALRRRFGAHLFATLSATAGLNRSNIDNSRRCPEPFMPRLCPGLFDYDNKNFTRFVVALDLALAYPAERP